MTLNFIRSPLYLAGALALTLGIHSPSTSYADISEADFARAFEAYLSKDANVEKMFKSFERFTVTKQKEEAGRQAEQEKKELEEQIKTPIKFDIGKAPVKGNPSAKITIAEFSDFECPYCQRGWQTMEEVYKRNGNDVRIAFFNLPLPFHKEARPAAKAAYAAGKQGKFWEMHDLLFENQKSLGSDSYRKHASTLGLNLEKFLQDMASPEAEEVIKSDEKKAEELGFSGTPSFLINGVKVSGARPAAAFQAIIDRLKK